MNEKEPNRLGLIVGGLFHYLPLALAFLMPVFFLSTTSEFFEFNKLALLTAATLLLLLAWTYKIVETKKIGITKSLIDFPLFLLLLAVVLSTIFSVNKTISIFGSQGRWFPSLFGAVILYAFYYLVSGNLKDKKFIKSSLMAFIGGVTLSSFVAILSYYRIYIGSAAYYRINNFTLAGSITTALVLAALAIVMALALMLYEESMQKKALLLVSLVINYFIVVLVSILPAWAVLGTGLLGIVFFISYKKITENTVFLTMAAGTLAAITLVVFLPTTRDLITNPDYPKELVLPVQESWIVASETVQDYPTLATGPSSFGLNFPRYRPLSLNGGDLWNVRFDKPFNEVFNTLATLGLVGLLVGAFFAYKLFQVVLASLKTHDEDGLSKVLGIAVGSLLVVYFFTYATFLNAICLVPPGSLYDRLTWVLNRSDVAEKFAVGLASIAPVTTIGEEGAIKKGVSSLHICSTYPGSNYLYRVSILQGLLGRSTIFEHL